MDDVKWKMEFKNTHKYPYLFFVISTIGRKLYELYSRTRYWRYARFV